MLEQDGVFMLQQMSYRERELERARESQLGLRKLKIKWKIHKYHRHTE